MKHAHFIGIGGIGMSGLAKILLKKEIVVSGSDINENNNIQKLKTSGANISIGHDENNVPIESTVIYGSDIKENNPELLFAKKNNLPLLHRADLLCLLMKDYQTLTVAGTHGKTTTSSLLTWVLSVANKDPSYAIGGILPDLKTNADVGSSAYFVAEADESDGTFLKYNSFASIITNLDNDHLNYYGSMEKLIDSFVQFSKQVKNLFWCKDDAYLNSLNLHGISYGFDENAALRISSFKQAGNTITYTIHFEGKKYSNIEVALIGKHNALNSAAVFGLALHIGVEENAIRQAFKSFNGVLRRFEKKFESNCISFYDDYAHHPTEIKSTLEGVFAFANGRKIIAVFEPHRYSRIKDCLGCFKNVFDHVDELYITDIYAAGEVPILGIDSFKILEEITNERIKKKYLPRNELAKELATNVKPHDLVITLGAGSITRLSDEVQDLLKLEETKKLKIGVVFGGESTEHEISLRSAEHILNCLKSPYYQVFKFGICKNGSWITGENALELLKNKKSASEVFPNEVKDNLLHCDVLIPVLHGPNGEDGTIQGFFELFGKPYVGPDHASAAIAMDKALTKQLILQNQIPTLPFVECDYQEWTTNKEPILRKMRKQLTYPLFIKPVHLGSTVGISKVSNEAEAIDKIYDAFQFDHKIIIENGLEKLREIEFAVMGNLSVRTFPPGEILTSGSTYDYEAKYSPQGMRAEAKAKLSQDKIEEGMDLAIKAYKAVGMTGMARVDFFLDDKNEFILNEINPIPGFTSISLYPKICEANGVRGGQLIDQLIIYALERNRKNRLLRRSYF